VTGPERVFDPLGRLSRIAEAHHLHVDGHGGNWGECNECGHSWPCPTYVWATDTNRDPVVECWDPADDEV
jgi:hypothetical protein